MVCYAKKIKYADNQMKIYKAMYSIIDRRLLKNEKCRMVITKSVIRENPVAQEEP